MYWLHVPFQWTAGEHGPIVSQVSKELIAWNAAPVASVPD